MSTEKHTTFADLIDEVQKCQKCARMQCSARVLNFSAGNLNADLFFVGEAPGRLGADETEVPFHGDVAGTNFEDFLDFAGIYRKDVYVTNCVLCNPKDVDGNNASPTREEIANCSEFLRHQIELVSPKIVVTLGALALRALESITPHGLSLATSVRAIHPWFGRSLIPLYHPGQRALIHRSAANQRSDYQFVREQWLRLTKPKTLTSGYTRDAIMQVVRFVLRAKPQISYFKLHKLIYLAEYLHVKSTGRRITSGYFIRQKDGPYCTDLQVTRLSRSDERIRVSNRGGELRLSLAGEGSTDLFGPQEQLCSDVAQTLTETISRYGDRDDAELKTIVYLTAPMRLILRREKTQRINMYNTPIDFLSAR